MVNFNLTIGLTRQEIFPLKIEEGNKSKMGENEIPRNYHKVLDS